MFKQLFSALKSGDVLDQAFSQFDEMLDHAQWMFLRANEVLHRKTTAADVKDSIYARDKSINDLLRSIRRKLVRHLTINPGTDIAASLVLMSVAKDAERIGDYCKNVFEVGEVYKKETFHVARYHDGGRACAHGAHRRMACQHARVEQIRRSRRPVPVTCVGGVRGVCRLRRVRAVRRPRVKGVGDGDELLSR